MSDLEAALSGGLQWTATKAAAQKTTKERPRRERKQVKRAGEESPEATKTSKKRKKAHVPAQTEPAETTNVDKEEEKGEDPGVTEPASEPDPAETGEESESESDESEPENKKGKKKKPGKSDKPKGKKKKPTYEASETESPTPKKKRKRSIVRHEGLPKLTSTNYGSWYEEVEDYLLTARAQEVLSKAQLRNGQEQDERADISDEQRIEIWYALRRSLTSEQKQTFQVPTGEVEELLRKVRQSNYKADTSTIALLMSDVADLQLAQFKNVQEFLNSSRALFAKLDDIGHHLTDGLRIFFLRKALPAPDYKTFLTVHADKTTVSSFANALIAFATENGDVMGTLNVRKLRENTNTTKEAAHWVKGKGKGKGAFIKGKGGKGSTTAPRKEPCKFFTQRGYCRFGDKCTYDHVVVPTKKTDNNAKTGKGKGGKGSDKCWICGKAGHRPWDCSSAFRNKVKEEKVNASTQLVNDEIYAEEFESSFKTTCIVHTARSSCAVSFLAGHVPESGRKIAVDYDRTKLATTLYCQEPTVSEFNCQDDFDNNVHQEDVQQIASEPDTVVLHQEGAQQNNEEQTEKVFVHQEGAHNTGIERPDEFTALLDGGSMCTIFNSDDGCVNIRGCDVTITTGTGVLKCTRCADFEGATEVNGIRIPITIKDVRIAPNFGQPLIAERHYLAIHDAAVDKQNGLASVKVDGQTVMQGTRARDGMYYVKLYYGANAMKTSHFVSSTDIAAYSSVQALDEERCLSCGQIDKNFIARCYSGRDQLKLMHERMGHRNMSDVARILGVPLPRKPLFCRACVEGKSSRLSFNHNRTTPFYEAPRAAYAWHVDMVEFSTLTDQGCKYLLVMVDGYSRKIVHELRKSQAEFDVTWEHHVAQVEAELATSGRIVANLVSDGAKYFDTRRMQAFNAKNGIAHLVSPPYTQELNHVAERTVRTVVEMARSMLIHSGMPRKCYGDAVDLAVYILNRLPWKRGANTTRIERYLGRKMNDPLALVRVLGCAAWIHQVHPTGPHRDKMDAKSALYVYAGVSVKNQCYKFRRLLDCKEVYSAHAIFNEEEFPFKHTSQAKSDLRAQDFIVPRKKEPATKTPEGKKVTWPALQSILKVHFATAGVTQPHQNSLAFMLDAKELCNALTLISTIGGAPRSVKKALQGEDGDEWLQSLKSELDSHKSFETLGPALKKEEIPFGVRPIPLNAVLKVKRDSRKKVRLIVKGFHLVDGVDYNDTFAGVPDISVLKLLLAIVTIHDWELEGSDAVTAYLQCDVDTPILVQVPHWYLHPSKDFDTKRFTYHFLRKAVPGIPQAPRLFGNKVHEIFSDFKMVRCQQCTSLYVCVQRSLIAVHWVDDFYLGYPKSSEKFAKEFWTSVRARLKMEEPAPVTEMLGCTITRNRLTRTTKIDQTRAIRTLQDKLNFSRNTSAKTPMATGFKLTKADCPERVDAEQAKMQSNYRSHLMSLNYVARWTMPQITYAVSKLGKFMANPGPVHFKALKRLLRFVFGRAEKGMLYPADRAEKNSVYGYWDTSHADDIDTRRTTMGHVFYYGGCAISWTSKLNTYVTTSTNQSEYCGLAKAAKEAKYLATLFESIGRADEAKPVNLFGDNSGAVAMAHNPVKQTLSKHIEIADHYSRELVEKNVITVNKIRTEDQIADIFTKALDEAKFNKHEKSFVG